MIITQERVRQLVSYDPSTGLFRWLVAPNGRVKIGAIAGSTTNRGYVRIALDGKRYLAHRLAFIYMTGRCAKEIDHIDGYRENNSFDNLRSVTRKQNCKNSKRSSSNTSGVTGVYWNKKLNKWSARICVDMKQIYLGLFVSFEAAVAARKKAEEEHGFHSNHGRTA